jgi:hypothetical protein
MHNMEKAYYLFLLCYEESLLVSPLYVHNALEIPNNLLIRTWGFLKSKERYYLYVVCLNVTLLLTLNNNAASRLRCNDVVRLL